MEEYLFDNMIELSPMDEQITEKENELYNDFREQLLANEQLYQKARTYYIHMRYAQEETGEVYNRIKNELMSYVDLYDMENSVRYELHEDHEAFYLGSIIAQLRISGGILSLYLRLDPEKYPTSDAVHKNVKDDPRFAEIPLLLKLTKETRVAKALTLIRDMMTGIGCTKDINYATIDYYSFFKRGTVSVARKVQDEEVSEVEQEVLVPVAAQEDIQEDDVIVLTEEIPEEEPVIEEVVDAEEETEEVLQEEEAPEEAAPTVYVYENISDPSQRPIFREIEDIDRKQVQGEQPSEDKRSIFDKEEPQQVEKKKKRKIPIIGKQIDVWKELADYGYHFVLLKQLEIYLLAIALSIGLGLILKLHWPFILALVAFVLLCLPSALSSYYKNKFEEKRFRDVESYIEQMLYSFRRNSKITDSLRDALVVFPSGFMHDKIVETLNYMRNSGKNGNVYEEGLKIIEEAYPCRRIKSLHRYLVKVEGVGGKHEAGVNALLKDRRLWIDRMDAFRKQASAIVKEIMISGIFSLAMACVIVYMMPAELFDLSTSIVYQIVTTIFAMVNMFVIKLTLQSTVITLQDEESMQTERTIKTINWLRTYDPKAEVIKSLKQCVVFVLIIILGFVIKNTVAIVAGLILLAYGIFLRRPMAYRSAKKRVCREIEKVYPDWLLELALLLQTDNMHVAIEKTLPTAPDIIKQDLQTLADDIMVHPTDLTPYVQFFDFLPLPNVQSSMKLLYSISEFGATDENVQLSELVERNNTLMDKAERYKNDDKISLVMTIKFIPMLSSSIKMLVDSMLFLLSYMSVIGGAL